MTRYKIITKLAIVFSIVLLIAIPQNLFAQEFEDNSISPFAISVNPLGFVQFGPIINVEFGFPNNLVLNIHTRFPSAGLLTYVALDHEDGIDDLSGKAFGAGLLYFFTDKRHKPYIGGLLEYHTADILYGQGDAWEWDKTENAIVVIANGGYRFRFGHFFLNTGAYLGAAFVNYEWDYTDPSYGEYDDDPRDGSEVQPFGMIEVTLGLEF
jgi:hypothetical protein